MEILRINSSQIAAWQKCREFWRLGYGKNYTPVKPAIHLVFGQAVHKVIEGYWAGKPYLEAFHDGFAITQTLDTRLLLSAELTRWNGMMDSFAKTADLYYKTNGDGYETNPAKLNEKQAEWPYHSPFDGHPVSGVMLYGTIDRVRGTTLTDTKTASAMKGDWRTEFKRHHLREPQLWFYLRYCEWARIPIDRVEYEIIVKSYQGSAPDIEFIDVTKEVFALKAKMDAQIDWAIREIYTFHTQCQDVAPWPMNSGTGCFTKYGACDFEPVCNNRVSVADATLYKIGGKTNEYKREGDAQGT
jgi:hypothetical protein